MRKSTIVALKNRLAKAKMIARDGNVVSLTALSLVFVFICGCSSSKKELEQDRKIKLTEETTGLLDSVAADFNFYPERWTTSGDNLWIINSRDSLFLTGFDLNRKEVFCTWGSIGEGPGEFVSPGIVEGNAPKEFTLYGNSENKIAQYILSDGIPQEIMRFKFPAWIDDKGLPKPYTRVTAINDSIFLGTYFLPHKAAADIFNPHSGKMIEELSFGVSQPEDRMSGPFEFKAAVTDNKVMVAYRFINRIEVYETNSDWTLSHLYSIGDKNDQSDLYEADRDDEMIKYYSDVACHSGKAYLLYHGSATGELEKSPTYLRVYDLESGNNLKNIKLDKYFDEILVTDSGKIILYSPVEENKIFMVSDN